MHRLSLNVFKIIAISMIFFLVLDTSIVIIDTYQVHKKIQSYLYGIQRVVIENNSVPETFAKTFDRQFQELLSTSNVAVKVNSNIRHSISVDGVYYEPLTPSDSISYGDFVDIVISVEMHPARVFLGLDSEGKFTTNKMFDVSYTLDYVVPVTCLRLLK